MTDIYHFKLVLCSEFIWIFLILSEFSQFYLNFLEFIWIYWEFFSKCGNLCLNHGNLCPNHGNSLEFSLLFLALFSPILRFFWYFHSIFRHLYSIFGHIHSVFRIPILFLDIVIPFLAIYSIPAICRIFVIFAVRLKPTSTQKTCSTLNSYAIVFTISFVDETHKQF